MPRVLLVEDDPDQLEVRRLVLEKAGHQVAGVAQTAREAASAFDACRPDVVMMDLRLPEAEDGLALIRHIRASGLAARIVVLAGCPSDLEGRVEARMVDELFSKPVPSRQLLQWIAKLTCGLLMLGWPLKAQPARSFPFHLDTAAEVVAELELSAPGGDWGRAGREGAVAVVTVDEGRRQHVMVYGGEQRMAYRVFLGELAAGDHQLRVERHPDYSARMVQLAIHGAVFRHYKPSDPEYLAIAHAPVLFARPNTVGKFTDIPLLAYCERLDNGSLRYSVVFSNEDGGTSTRGLMARWGRATDIEYVYQVWVDGKGAIVKAQIQGPNHKDVPFLSRREGQHPLLGVVTDNNMVAADGVSAVRYQPAPILVDLSKTAREQVMDDHPYTYLISARELEREGKLRSFGAVEGEKISAPENYLYLEMQVLNKEARVAVLAKLVDEGFFRSSNLGLHEYAIERSGWVRTGVELPPATQPAQLEAIALLCLAENKTSGGACRVESIRKMFFLTAQQTPGPNFWQPKLDRGPWFIPAGQMRIISLR